MGRRTAVRLFVALAVVALATAAMALLPPAALAQEPNTNRGGMDYKHFNLPAADPGLCRTACDGEAQCKAYTYVKPGIQGPSAVCWLKNGIPPAVPDTCCESGVKVALPPPPSPDDGGAATGQEPHTNRPGNDYKHFELSAADPGLCKAACDAEGQCKAYTYVKPGQQGPKAVCWLKTAVPAAKPDNCCSSGVKVPLPPPPSPEGGADMGQEPHTNRPGNDYKHFNLAAANPDLCKAACDAEGQCKAYTYVKPGQQGPSAVCWLKTAVPPAKTDPCCSSGVKITLPPPPSPEGGADMGQEPHTNRPGKDYKHFNLAAANPDLCKVACDAEGQCKAYTYVKPGMQGPNAVCWLKTDVPPAKTDPCCSSGVKISLPPPPSPEGGADMGQEPHTNRPGKDYKHFNLAAANPDLCKVACDAEGQCKAYTYVKPGMQGPSAVCWLKTDVPVAKADPCCSSGVKAAGPGGGADQGEEPGTNRPGKDYKHFNLAAANPGLCKAACDSEAQCKAYTYVKPGMQGPSAVCWLKTDVPVAKADPCCSSGVKAAGPGGGADQGEEPGTNRPGKDYKHFNLAAANPGLCKAACDSEAQCKAYTYVKPGMQGPSAVCWLKTDVPVAKADPCCSSGVKAAGPGGGADQGEEPGTNRPGKDYKHFNLAAANPGLCKAACDAEGQCKAYTYVKPGMQGPSAVCWLKTDVPVAKADPCCSSGVKAAGPGGGADQGEEPGTNRPGKDYKHFNLAAANPDLCKAACDAEGQCKAYTYVKPGMQGPSAVCWLKTDVPPAKADPCCSSGVKITLPPPPSLDDFGAAVGEEPHTNRPGKDYKNFVLAAPDPDLCRAACDAEGQCKAYTYVKPGIQGPSARCWLKTAVPAPKTDPCCSSGVKIAVVGPQVVTPPVEPPVEIATEEPPEEVVTEEPPVVIVTAEPEIGVTPETGQPETGQADPIPRLSPTGWDRTECRVRVDQFGYAVPEYVDVDALLPEWVTIDPGAPVQALEGTVVGPDAGLGAPGVSPADLPISRYTHDFAFFVRPDSAPGGDYTGLLRAEGLSGDAPQEAIEVRWETGLGANNDGNPLAELNRAGESGGFFSAGHSRGGAIWNWPVIGDWVHVEGIWAWERAGRNVTAIHPARLVAIQRRLPDFPPSAPNVLATRVDLFASGDGGALHNNRGDVTVWTNRDGQWAWASDPNVPAFPPAAPPAAMSETDYSFRVFNTLPAPSATARLKWVVEKQPGDTFPGELQIQAGAGQADYVDVVAGWNGETAPDDAVLARTIYLYWNEGPGVPATYGGRVFKVTLDKLAVSNSHDSLAGGPRGEYRVFVGAGNTWLFANELAEGDDVLRGGLGDTAGDGEEFALGQSVTVVVPPDEGDQAYGFWVLTGGWEADGGDQVFGQLIDPYAVCDTQEGQGGLELQINGGLLSWQRTLEGCADDDIGQINDHLSNSGLTEVFGEANDQKTGRVESNAVREFAPNDPCDGADTGNSYTLYYGITPLPRPWG